jgi:AraC-like DNA-binding protein
MTGDSMRKNWFYRLLLSYLPVFFIICLSLLLMTYLTISEMSKRSANKANEALSHNVMQLIDDALAGIDSLMLKEIQSNGRLQLFYAEQPQDERQYADVQAASAIKELTANNPLIDSIYLYRLADQTVLTPFMITKLDTFADRQYLGLTVSTKTPYAWTLRSYPQPEQDASKPEEKIISLAKIANLSDYSTMVVNIRPERLRLLMQSMVYTQTTFMEVRDRAGRLVVSTDGGGSTDTGLEPAKGFRSKTLSEAHSELTGWTFRSGNHGEVFAEFVSSLFYLWMALGCFIVLAGLAWLIYVSRRNYKPIRSLMNRISNVRPASAEDARTGKVDEFQLIESAIEGLLDESNILQEQHQKNMVYRKRYLFLSMMEGAAGTRPKTGLAELEQMGVVFPVTETAVALAEIDHYAEFERQYRNDQHLLKHVLSMVVQEMAETKPYTVWTEWIDRCRMAILVIYSGQEKAERETADFCEALRQWVEENLDFTVTIGIGCHVEDMDRVSQSFREAVAATGFKSSLGYNRIIEPAHVISKPKGELFRQLQCIRSISQSFRAGEKKWETYYEEMYEGIRDQLYAYEDLAGLMTVLIGHLQKEMAELPEELHQVWQEFTHDKLLAALERKETLDEIYGEFRIILQEAYERMSELRESKSTHQLVHQVKRYIRENYHNPDLSLMHLSDEFGLNAKYVSRVFREAFGVKFVEYVTAVRMEQAMQRLLETEGTIQEIGQAVGYEQSLTFIRVFKKYTGTTPGQYRKMKILPETD